MTLPDLQNRPDERGIAIERVGITNVKFPIRVRTKEGGFQETSARVKLFVGLPEEYKGVNMSRFMESLVEFRDINGDFSGVQMPDLLKTLMKNLKSKDAYARFEFDYFINITAPVSKKVAPQAYRCAFTGILQDDGTYDFVLEVNVTAASLCPCSKEMSLLDNLMPEETNIPEAYASEVEMSGIGNKVGMGAHNQRSQIRAEVIAVPDQIIWIEDVVSLIEAQASAPVFPILKRPDEKYVTELAYKNPKFSEDITRDVQTSLMAHPLVSAWRLRVFNEESIHTFDVCCYQESDNWQH